MNRLLGLSTGRKEGKGKSLMHMYYTYSGVPKDTYQAEATLNSEKNQAVALVIIKLLLSEGQ